MSKRRCRPGQDDSLTGRRHRHPRSLFARLMLIWLVGMLLVLGTSFGLFWGERGRSTRNQFFEQVATDVVTVVLLLDALPPVERPAMLERLKEQRTHYRISLTPIPSGHALEGEFDHPAWSKMARQLGARPLKLVAARHGEDDRPTLYLGTQLADGTPFLVAASLPRPGAPSGRSVAAFLVLIGGLAALTWFAVRLATRPLTRLARAATALGEDLEQPPLPERGPEEVRRASAAFNRMQSRIRELFAERTRILSAVTHDLQTPMTRLRLRAELIADDAQREKTLADLDEMQTMVAEGLAYARSMSPATEAMIPVQLDALLAVLAADYIDSGQPVQLDAPPPMSLLTRPQMLRRLLANLVDNALKFGADARLSMRDTPDAIDIVVRDHGPGLPPAELEKVFEPFYRVDASRNRDSGGTGLGLAIASRLAQALGAGLTLENHSEGGLEARLSLPKQGDGPV